MPCRGPSESPRTTADSASRDAASASSAQTVMKALSTGCARSTRANVLCTISTGESCLLRINAERSAADA
jgi:hypothetical protein